MTVDERQKLIDTLSTQVMHAERYRRGVVLSHLTARLILEDLKRLQKHEREIQKSS